MSKISMMGTIKCQDGKADEMAQVLTAMVDAATDEPGVEIYSYHRSDDDTFWFFALMATKSPCRTTARARRCRPLCRRPAPSWPSPRK